MKNIGAGNEISIWRTAAFLKLLIPMVIGIVVEKYFPLNVIFLVPVFCLSFFLILLFNSLPFKKTYGLNWMAGIAVQFAFFSFGRVVGFIHHDITIDETDCFSKNCSNLLLLRLLTDPVSKPKSWKAVVKVVGLVKGERCFVENEKVLVYFGKNVDVHQVSSSSTIIINKKLISIQNIRGTDFDYVGYCRLRHIYAQVYLTENDFTVVSNNNEKGLLSVLDNFRGKLLIILKKQIPGKSESGFLEALLFGYTDDLDVSLMKSYADTGVIHIIAISGLHLALICQLLQLGLFRLSRKPSSIWLNFILTVSVLWAYSLFSGASPSVIRAAAMFSLALFARNIKRESFFYNSLSASAVLLLCYDPDWLWDTGFQLSYAAVLGLGIFAGRVEALIHLKNKTLRVIWKACSVSIAAQLLTLPLSIYYFHQFPVYFLFANLVAVPLSSAILLGGMALCILYPIVPLAKILGWGLELGGKTLNGTITFFSKLPGSVISSMKITLPQLFCLYLITFCFYWFLKKKKAWWLLAGLTGILLFQLFQFPGKG